MSKKEKVSVRVGWSGTKVHPAYRHTDDNGNESVMAVCGCPHTNSGFKKLNLVADGWDHANCGKLAWSEQ